MRRALILLLAVMVSGCGSAAERTLAPPPATDRIVSIDYCADQMVLGLVERNRIAAVSPETAADPLFAERLARALPRVRPEVEAILALRPTLVVRSYAGGERLEAMLRRAGVPVLTLPYAATLADVRAGVASSAAALGAGDAAARRLAQFDHETRPSVQAPARALYTTPGDYTAGTGTLIDEAIRRAGWHNAETRTSWRRLDAEGLIARPPALVIRAFGESRAHRTDLWSGSAHQALRRAFGGSTTVDIPGSWLACGNWRIGHAIAAMREAGSRD